MVLAFKQPWNIELRREHLFRVGSWVLLAAVSALFGWAYLSNQKPGPYGSCYASRGHPIPCGPVQAKAVDSKALPVRTAP
jgi:hypothetical protein